MGIDFDVPHFDWGYLFLTNTSCNARVVMQAAHRVRQLCGNRVFVLCHHAYGSYTRPPFLRAVRADLAHTRATMHRLLRQCITVPENPTQEELAMIKEAASSGHLREYSEALVSVLAYNELENRKHKRHFVKMINEYLEGAGYELVEEELMAEDLPEVTLAPVCTKVAFVEKKERKNYAQKRACIEDSTLHQTQSTDRKSRARGPNSISKPPQACPWFGCHPQNSSNKPCGPHAHVLSQLHGVHGTCMTCMPMQHPSHVHPMASPAAAAATSPSRK